MRACLAALPVLLLGCFAGDARAGAANSLPTDAAQALHSAKQVELYSLEPWFDEDTKETKWHGYVLLGHATLSGDKARQAAAQFEAAISAKAPPKLDCFEPRHALGVESGGHRYELLLSYECHALEVYADGKRVGRLVAARSSASLDKLLRQAKVPLSQSASD